MNNSLLHIVRQDVNQFLEQFNELLFNERDFQMHLATWLRNSANSYDDVDVEYFVPWHELEKVGEYIWKTELRLDIVVKKDSVYVPIELKYKTKKLTASISRLHHLILYSFSTSKSGCVCAHLLTGLRQCFCFEQTSPSTIENK